LTITKDDTTIIHGAAKKADIEARTQIKQQIDDTTSDYDKEKLQERLVDVPAEKLTRRRWTRTNVGTRDAGTAPRPPRPTTPETEDSLRGRP
jgi:hypothetical protein